MLMDEPFSALDPLTRQRLQDELLQLHKINGQTILYVTYSIAEAAYLADRIIILQHRSIGHDIRVDASQPKDRLGASCLRLQHQLRRVLLPDNNIPLTPKI
jgi:ABC-type nitrate/sulfonate/bicarbonate transport system ATPase subunit